MASGMWNWNYVVIWNGYNIDETRLGWCSAGKPAKSIPERCLISLTLVPMWSGRIESELLMPMLMDDHSQERYDASRNLVDAERK